MSGDFSKFAQRLKAARLKMGISQKYLAEQVGIRSATLSAYENAEAEKRVTPSLENAVALARELEVSLDYLCGIDATGIKKSTTDKIREYLYTLTKTCELFPYDAKIDGHHLDGKRDTETGFTDLIEWFGVNFRENTAVYSFLKSLDEIWKLYKAGTLNEEIYNAVVESLCDKYATLAAAEEEELPF